MGTTAYALDGAASDSFISGTFEVTATSDFQLQHIASRTCNSAGYSDTYEYDSSQGGNFGCPADVSQYNDCQNVIEVYAMVEINKVQ